MIQLLKQQLKKKTRNNPAGVRIIDPMAYRKNILLGRIIKASGYKGAVSVKLQKTFTEDIPDMESVFLEIEGRPVPFFIAELDYSGGDILKLTFDGYETPDKVSEFTGCDVFLTENYAQQTEKEDDPASFEGYRVKLTSGETIGIIREVIFNSGQWLLDIFSTENKEILVPFHEDLILDIDNKNRHIIMDIPEGLTEIN